MVTPGRMANRGTGTSGGRGHLGSRAVFVESRTSCPSRDLPVPRCRASKRHDLSRLLLDEGHGSPGRMKEQGGVVSSGRTALGMWACETGGQRAARTPRPTALELRQHGPPEGASPPQAPALGPTARGLRKSEHRGDAGTGHVGSRWAEILWVLVIYKHSWVTSGWRLLDHGA